MRLKPKMEHISGIKQRAVKTKLTVTLQEYYRRLENLDWNFSSSDSKKHFDRGAKDMDWVELLASFDENFQELFKQFREYKLSGQPETAPVKPKPPFPAKPSNLSVLVPVLGESGAYLMCAATDRTNEIWDKTITDEGHFILREIAGRGRIVGVYSTYENVNAAAVIAVSHINGEYDDVQIENIAFFEPRNATEGGNHGPI